MNPLILITIKKKKKKYSNLPQHRIDTLTLNQIDIRYLKKNRGRDSESRKKFPRNNATRKRGEKWRERKKEKKKKRKMLCSFQISRLDFFHSIFIKTREPFLGNALRCFPLHCHRGGGARVSRESLL